MTGFDLRVAVGDDARNPLLDVCSASGTLHVGDQQQARFPHRVDGDRQRLRAPVEPAEQHEVVSVVAHGRVTNDLKRSYVELADSLGIGVYIGARFMFCGTPDEVETQIRAAIGAGAMDFDGAIDADLDEHQRRITKWARLVMPRFG